MLPTPENGDEAAYISVATLKALLELLIRKKVINHADVAIMMLGVADGLSKENNSASQRAASLFAKRN